MAEGDKIGQDQEFMSPAYLQDLAASWYAEADTVIKANKESIDPNLSYALAQLQGAYRLLWLAFVAIAKKLSLPTSDIKGPDNVPGKSN